jgi:hypothetical protein
MNLAGFMERHKRINMDAHMSSRINGYILGRITRCRSCSFTEDPRVDGRHGESVAGPLTCGDVAGGRASDGRDEMSTAIAALF